MTETKTKKTAKSGELVTAKSAVPTAKGATDVPSDGYEALKSQPLVVTLRGRVWNLRPLPAVTMLDLALLGDPKSTDIQGARAIHDFLHGAISKEQSAEWSEFLRESEPLIEMDELVMMIQQMLETLTARPTMPS